ncbi:MAG: sterol desaturase family protein [Bdellovibrionales bacterium]|nr:sterol desaturase family protein [Bdellovibrionales bacterium]
MNETSSIFDVLWFQWIQTFARYAIFAGGAYLLFWKQFHRRFMARQLYPWPAKKQVLREILFSIRTTLVFIVAGAGGYYGVHAGIFKFYWKIEEHGWLWLGTSVVILILMHDTFFYWVHRWMHHPRIFKAVHRIHHESLNPTPFTALSFDLSEALIQSLIIPLGMLLMPLHGIAIFAFLLFSITTNVYGHLGIDLNRKAHQDGILRFMTSPKGHAMHHQKFRGNYGLYFTWWDRWMGTEIDRN